MAAIQDEGQLEKQRAEEIIASANPMDGIENIAVELGDDFSGDPAMWLVFYMRPDLNADDEWLKRLNEYSHQLGMRMIQSGLTRFPYTRLKRAA